MQLGYPQLPNEFLCSFVFLIGLDADLMPVQ
jgi:hypothetical protein